MYPSWHVYVSVIHWVPANNYHWNCRMSIVQWMFFYPVLWIQIQIFFETYFQSVESLNSEFCLQSQIFCLYFVIFLADRDINWLLMDGTHCDAEISTWYAVGMYRISSYTVDVISGIGSHTGGVFTGLEKWIPAGRSGSWRSFPAGIGERVGVYRLSNGVSHVYGSLP